MCYRDSERFRRRGENLLRTRPSLILALLLCGLLVPTLVGAEKISADQMQQMLLSWPPQGWLTTPPDSVSSFPPYIATGEFSGTIYRPHSAEKIWSAHVSVTDQHSAKQAKQMLKKYQFCSSDDFRGLPARTCTTQGEDLGRLRQAYVTGRFLVEISVIGPLPLEVPELELNEGLIFNISND